MDESLYVLKCRRDKKYKIVDKEWLEVCDWLCPKCYYKLTEEQKKEFAPAGEYIKPKPISGIGEREQRELERFRAVVESHKPLPNPPEPELEVQEINGDNPDASRVTEEPSPSEPPPKRKKGRPKGTVGYNPVIESVKPQHRIDCKKCGKSVPCFSLWLERSKVLCPSCYYAMSEKQRSDFEFAYGVNGGTFKSEFNSPRWNRKETDSVSTAVGMSEAAIHRATPQELSMAVKRGRLSAVRMRMELNRRRKAFFYSEFADGLGTVNMRGMLSQKGM